MIPNGEGQRHHLATKRLSALLRGITSKYQSDFYYLNCLHSFGTENNSDKAPFVIYADLGCLIEKIDGCKNNPGNLFTSIVSKHVPLGFSLSTISLFKNIQNKHEVYRGKNYMNKLCESLRDHAMKIINFKIKKMKLLI